MQFFDLNDRTGLNKALTAVDMAAEETVDRNMERRYEEKLRTAQNIETRRYQDAVLKADSADTLKHTLRESSHRARDLISEEKSLRFNALNPMNDSGLLTESRTLSTYTSSKVCMRYDGFVIPSFSLNCQLRLKIEFNIRRGTRILIILHSHI